MTTPNTGIPYVPEATLDPAAGLNLALNVIDALLQTAVISIGDAEPPSASDLSDGDLYIVGTGAGDWAGEDDNLARYVADGDFWQFYDAGVQVHLVLNKDDGGLYAYNGSDGWQPALPGSAQAHFAPVVTEPSDAVTLSADTVGDYTVLTDDDVTITIQAEATQALPVNGEWAFEYRGNTTAEFVGESDVEITAPKGGSLVLETGDVVVLKRTAADEFKLIGSTEAAS